MRLHPARAPLDNQVAAQPPSLGAADLLAGLPRRAILDISTADANDEIPGNRGKA
jgi:hypothetical protein